MDAQKVTRLKIEYVLALKAVIRELGGINRTEENLEAKAQIEEALTDCISEPRESTPHIPGLVHA